MGRAANSEAIENMNLVRVAICFQLCSVVQLHREGGKYHNFQTQTTTLLRGDPEAVTVPQHEGNTTFMCSPYGAGHPAPLYGL